LKVAENIACYLGSEACNRDFLAAVQRDWRRGHRKARYRI